MKDAFGKTNEAEKGQKEARTRAAFEKLSQNKTKAAFAEKLANDKDKRIRGMSNDKLLAQRGPDGFRKDLDAQEVQQLQRNTKADIKRINKDAKKRHEKMTPDQIKQERYGPVSDRENDDEDKKIARIEKKQNATQKTDAQAKTAKLGRKGKWKESQGGKGRAEVSKIAKEMKADGKTGWVTIGGAKINLG
jgi:hypothetical protein